jgi:prophage regulatory protein
MSKPLVLPNVGWVREPVVLAVTPFGRTKLREEIAAGRFPAPKKFSERLVAWDAEQVHQWIGAQRQSSTGYSVIK